MGLVFHSRPWITDEDISAVREVLETSMLGQGERVRCFEQRLAAWFNAKDGVAVGSGSAAIVLALRGLGVTHGDEVVMPTYVCRSVLEAVLTVGATPVLCDAGPEWVITPASAMRAMSVRTKAILVPHLYGLFADIESFCSLGVPIIEDCAQALDGEKRRSLRSDVAVFSFHPTKCLTAGEGGIAISSNTDVVKRMRMLRDGCGDGFHSRLFSPLSDLAAALALSQLNRYDQGLARRREIAAHYLSVIEATSPTVVSRATLERGMFFRFPVRIAGGAAACQDEFYALGVMVRKGVDALLHRGLGLSDTEFPVAVQHFATTVSLPIYPALTQTQEDSCVNAIRQVLPHFHQSISE